MFFCSYVVNIKTPIFVSTKKLYGTRNTTQRPQQTGVSSYAYGRAYTESDYDPMFGCERSKNTHIERKKSKCDYILSVEPTAEMITEIENRVNEVIGQDLPVTTCFVTREEVPEGVDLSKLPEDASATLRIVKIGEYDTCACIGQHVGTTAEIGKFKIISWDFESNRLRLRFKLEL